MEDVFTFAGVAAKSSVLISNEAFDFVAGAAVIVGVCVTGAMFEVVVEFELDDVFKTIFENILDEEALVAGWDGDEDGWESCMSPNIDEKSLFEFVVVFAGTLGVCELDDATFDAGFAEKISKLDEGADTAGEVVKLPSFSRSARR